MRVLVAPDKFKGSFTARRAAEALARGVARGRPSARILLSPMADGGEGTLDVVLEAAGGSRRPVEAAGPLGEAVAGDVALLPGGGLLVESARFCGLHLVPLHRRDPLEASTRGLGALLQELLREEPPGLWVGLGGSATVDGGLGLARSLGYRLLARDGRLLDGRGRDLDRLERILPPEAGRSPGEVIALADTLLPLTGPRGAVRTFAAQKGAGRVAQELLERGMDRLAAVVERDLGVRVADLPGGAAAGGLGAGLAAFLGARVESGAATVARLTGLEGLLEGIDLIVTGEGAFHGDHQGKVCHWICAAAAGQGVPVAVVTGSVDGGAPPGVVRFISPKGWLGEKELEEAGRSAVLQGFSLE